MENIEDITPLENAPDRNTYRNQRNYEKAITSWLLKFVVFGNKIISIFKSMQSIFNSTNELVQKVEKIDEQVANAKNETLNAMQEAQTAAQTATSVVIPTNATYSKDAIDEKIAVIGMELWKNTQQINKLKLI